MWFGPSLLATDLRRHDEPRAIRSRGKQQRFGSGDQDGARVRRRRDQDRGLLRRSLDQGRAPHFISHRLNYMTPALPQASSAPGDDFVIQLALERGLLHPAQVDAARAIAAGHRDEATPAPRALDLLVQQGALTS